MRANTWRVLCLLGAVVGGTACGHETDNVQGVGMVGARRLSRNEYDNTVRDLLFDESRSGFAKLPEDVNDPFDNDFTTQQPSGVLVEAAETLALEAASRLLADPDKRDRVVGCTPTGPDDADCLRSFVTHFGRLALRRPLAAEEIDAYLAFQSYAVEGGDFYIAVGMVISALLQDPEFLYRIEVGRPASGRPGLYRLNDFEVGTRLSYFLWGSTPDDELLDLAEHHGLSSPSDVRAAAQRLLADPRSHARVDRFHALWLGYHQLPHAADLTTSMRTEVGALVDRVVFEEARPWTDLFTSDEAYVDQRLADLYGMPAPASGFAWEPYGAAPGNRRGILSSGAFLSVAGKFGDTSPTQRGKLVRERLLCQAIPPPPPNVNVDQPPVSPSSNCKYDRYEAHRANGSCAACHNNMDPVGFGLENFDQTGKYRTTDNGEPTCTIAGDGLLFGLGEGGAPLQFHGPGELGDALVTSGLLETCLVLQMYRFAHGHREHDEDGPSIDALSTKFAQSHKFDELMLELVSLEAFGYRQEEE